MLVRILPEQVSRNWEYFAPMLAETFPPELGVSRTLLTNVLAAVLRDDLLIWLSYENEEEGNDQPVAMITTWVREDPIMCIRTLIVYNLYIIKKLGIQHWKGELATLQKYANAADCTNIAGYVWDPVYARFLRQLGADTSTMIAVF